MKDEDSGSALKTTPLNRLHQSLNARMVPFAGYSLPLQYGSGIITEHNQTREKASLFDVSHMGQIRIHGADAAEALETIVPGSIDGLAKRMIDYGFHAPTMSWPVAGTLMVEPTESEPREELDRICDAMIAIAGEAKRVATGEWPADDNPLVNSPHTVGMVTDDNWPHPYSRANAAYPVETLRRSKYWSPVSRIDNVHGDRNLDCTCPPLEAYMDAAE